MASKSLAVLDLETDPFKIGRVPEPYLAGVRWEDRYATFPDVKQAVEFIKKKKLLCYAHNGGKFDYMYFLKYLASGTKLKIINGRLAEFQMGESTMRDSWCRYPMALKTHRKQEIEYWKMEKEFRGQYWAEINEYLREDCDSLYDLMEYGHRTYGGGLTLAGSAMNFWKELTGIEPPRSNASYYKEFNQYYFGGRVECFQYGIFHEKISVYDINSAYPFAMLHQHPWGLNYEVYSDIPKEEINGRDFVELEGPALGYFPIKDAKQGQDVFPHSGESRPFSITGWEYNAVLAFHPEYPHKITKVIKFRENIQFTEYVNHFYNLKKKAAKNSPEYLFAKLMMNSLYGKFGANPEEYEDNIIVPPNEYEYWEASTRYRLSDIIYPWALLSAPLPEQAQRYYDVALAASITGFPRAYGLTALVNSFGRRFYENKALFYYDTDGVQARDGSLDVAIGQDLGQWNVEFTASRAGYSGPKLYTLENGDYSMSKEGKETGVKIASKGVKLNSRELFQIAAGAEIKWQNPAPTMSVKGGIRFIERRVKRRK